MTQEWYYAKDGTKHGPVTVQQLKKLAASGELQPSDLVWTQGRDEWGAAGAVNGLFSTPPIASTKPPPVGIQPTSANREEATASTVLDRAMSVATQIGAAAKSAALVTAKQAERTKILNVSLPTAYAALGKLVYTADSFRGEFPDLFSDADELQAKIADIESRAKARPKGEGFTGKAKAVGAVATDKAEIQTHRLRVSRQMAKLGQAVFEMHGKDGGPAEAVTTIEQLLERSESLRSEIDGINKSGSESISVSRVPSWVHSWPAATVSLLCCFPIGLGIVWTHPRWTMLHKSIWSGGWLVLMMIAIAAGPEHQVSAPDDDRGVTSGVASNSDPDEAESTQSHSDANSNPISDEVRTLAQASDMAYLLTLRRKGVQDAPPLHYLVLIDGQRVVAGWIEAAGFKPEQGFEITQESRREFKEIDGRQIPMTRPLIAIKDIFDVDEVMAVQTWKKLVIHEFDQRSGARYEERTRMTDRTGLATNRSPVISDDKSEWNGPFERIK